MTSGKEMYVDEFRKDELSRDYNDAEIKKKLDQFFKLYERKETQEPRKKKIESEIMELNKSIEEKIKEFKKTNKEYELLELQKNEIIKKLGNQEIDKKVKSCEIDSQEDKASLNNALKKKEKEIEKLLEKYKSELTETKEILSKEKELIDIQFQPSDEVQYDNLRYLFQDIYNSDNDSFKRKCRGHIYKCFMKEYSKTKNFTDMQLNKIEKFKSLFETLFTMELPKGNKEQAQKNFKYLSSLISQKRNKNSTSEPAENEIIIDKLLTQEGQEDQEGQKIIIPPNYDLNKIFNETNTQVANIKPVYFSMFTKNQLSNIDPKYIKTFTKDQLENLTEEAWDGIEDSIQLIEAKNLQNIKFQKVFNKLTVKQKKELFKINNKKFKFFQDEIKADTEIKKDEATTHQIKELLENDKKSFTNDELKIVLDKMNDFDKNLQPHIQNLIKQKVTKENVDIIESEINDKEFKKEILKHVLMNIPLDNKFTPVATNGDDGSSTQGDMKKKGEGEETKPDDGVNEAAVPVKAANNEENIKQILKSMTLSELNKVKQIQEKNTFIINEITELKNERTENDNNKWKEKIESDETMKRKNLNAELFFAFNKEIQNGGNKTNSASLFGGGDKDDGNEARTLANMKNINTEMIEKWKNALDDIDDEFFDIDQLKIEGKIEGTDENPDEYETEYETLVKTIMQRKIEKYVSTAGKYDTVLNDIKPHLNNLVKNYTILKSDKETIIRHIKSLKKHIENIAQAKEKLDVIKKTIDISVTELKQIQKNIENAKTSTSKGKREELEKDKTTKHNKFKNKINDLIDDFNNTVKQDKTEKPTNGTVQSPPVETVTTSKGGEPTDNKPTKIVKDLITSLETILKRGKSSGNNGDDNNKYSEIWKTYVKDINDEDKQISEVRDRFYKSFKSNNIDPSVALKLTNDDRIIFIITIFIYRQIALAITEKLIHNGYITSLSSTMITYCISYIILLVLTLILVNFDEYKFRIIFNHFNMHNSSFSLHYHILIKIGLIVMLYTLAYHMNPEMVEVKDKLNEIEKMNLSYKLEILTISVFTLVAIIEFL
jgi:hypothetical protein